MNGVGLMVLLIGALIVLYLPLTPPGRRTRVRDLPRLFRND